MGKKSGKSPSYNPPAPPQLQQASTFLPKATDWAKQNFAGAYGAREGALQDLSKGVEYYQGFQPTSLEQALGSQYFENVMPDIERSIKHSLSLSGIASSPILSQQIAKARGDVGVNVGQYLANQANQRAQQSLVSRLGIDPSSVYGPYLNTDVNQSNQQAGLDYNYAQQKAQADYQAEMQKYNQKKAGIGALGTGLGALAGGLLALPTGGLSVLAGAGLGALGGSTLSPLIGGSSTMNPSSALSMFDFTGGVPSLGQQFDFGGYGVDPLVGGLGDYGLSPSGVTSGQGDFSLGGNLGMPGGNFSFEDLALLQQLQGGGGMYPNANGYENQDINQGLYMPKDFSEAELVF